MENKSEGNEAKIVVRDFNWTLDKMEIDGGNKPQGLSRYSSNCAHHEFIHYDRSSGTRSRIDRVYTDFQDWKKRLRNFYKKENFKPEIKPMNENFQDELYQLENK